MHSGNQSRALAGPRCLEKLCTAWHAASSHPGCIDWSQLLLALQATRPVDLLKADVPTIVKAAAQQLRDKSQKTKIGVFLVLKELATLLPGSISVEVARMVPGIEAALDVSWACWPAD